jgi:hypothetical protein
MPTNKELIESLYGSFAVGDVPAVLGALADDIRWTEAEGFPLAGTYVGPQAVLEGVFMRLGEIGDHYTVVPEHHVADGDTVMTLGTLRRVSNCQPFDTLRTALPERGDRCWCTMGRRRVRGVAWTNIWMLTVMRSSHETCLRRTFPHAVVIERCRWCGTLTPRATCSSARAA